MVCGQVLSKVLTEAARDGEEELVQALLELKAQITLNLNEVGFLFTWPYALM